MVPRIKKMHYARNPNKAFKDEKRGWRGGSKNLPSSLLLRDNDEFSQR